MLTTYAIVAVIAYLLGSIPFGYILVRVFRGEDVRAIGSGNIGATNVARTGHRGLAIATLLLDASKGFLAVLIAEQVWLRSGGRNFIDCLACTPMGTAAMVAASFAVLGHMFPAWLRFKGGKGVATALGALVVIDPAAVLASLIRFAIAVGISRYVSVGSIVAAVVYPIAMLFIPHVPTPNLRDIWPVIVISLLVVLKHHTNIRRLISGTENRLGGKSNLRETRA